MPKKSSQDHNSKKEISFLDGLGSYTEKEHRKAKTILLKNYIDASKKRIKWGDIDAIEVVEYAKKLLLIEQGKEISKEIALLS